MRLHRFYVVQPLGEELVVDQKNSASLLHQWISVFRFAIGDEVLLFSEGSRDFLYRFDSLSKKEARLSFIETRLQKEIKSGITLYLALVKKDTFEKVTRQATELGVSKIVPILAERSEKKGLNLERLRVIAIEASEQSGRGSVPLISSIIPFEKALNEIEGEHFFASFEGDPISLQTPKSGLSLWIGPEGGWSPEEEEKAKQKGLTKVALTETVLKADTAAIALLSYLVLS